MPDDADDVGREKLKSNDKARVYDVGSAITREISLRGSDRESERASHSNPRTRIRCIRITSGYSLLPSRNPQLSNTPHRNISVSAPMLRFTLICATSVICFSLHSLHRSSGVIIAGRLHPTRSTMTRPTLLVDDSSQSKAAILVASVAHAEPTITHSTSPPLPRLHTTGGDVTAFPLIITHLSADTSLAVQTHQQQNELDKWVDLFLSITSTSLTPNVLEYLDAHLLSSTYLLSSHLTAADLLLFSALHGTVVGWSKQERGKWVSLMRWFTHVQNHQHTLEAVHWDIPGSTLFMLDLNPQPVAPKPAAAAASPAVKKAAAAAAAEPGSTMTGHVVSAAAGAVSAAASAVFAVTGAVSGTASAVAGNVAAVAGKAAEAVSSPSAELTKKEKRPSPTSSAPSSAAETPQIYRLDLRVATILTCAPHPTESRLAVLTIDVGEAQPRQVVSGIADYVDMAGVAGRCVLCMCNLKAGDIKGVDSNGRLLVATDPTDDKRKEVCWVEGATVVGGERVHVVRGVESDAVLAPKNLHRILKGLRTDGEGVVMYEDLPIETSAGKVKVTIKNGTVG